ncbi:hypothetical protein PInf_023616 [Phytophthora infestans]|nr:hypothetical protein PInf_023616 [Phytophthora infestans]
MLRFGYRRFFIEMFSRKRFFSKGSRKYKPSDLWSLSQAWDAFMKNLRQIKASTTPADGLVKWYAGFTKARSGFVMSTILDAQWNLHNVTKEYHDDGYDWVRSNGEDPGDEYSGDGSGGGDGDDGYDWVRSNGEDPGDEYSGDGSGGGDGDDEYDWVRSNGEDGGDVYGWVGSDGEDLGGDSSEFLEISDQSRSSKLASED